MKRRGILQNSYGHNLIEVMIAAGIIGGLGLLSSDYIVNSIKSTQQIQDSTECHNAITAIASKIKEDDNLRVVEAWQPRTLSEAQNPNLRRRFWQPLAANPLQIGSALPLNADMGQALDTNLAANINNYQLIESSSVEIGAIYNSIDTCNWFTPNANSTYLSDVADDYTGNVDNVFFKIERINLSNNGVDCGPTFPPIPINRNANASTNFNTGFKVGIQARYQDPQGTTRRCEGSVTLHPGADSTLPGGTVGNVPSINLSNSNLIPNGDIFCGDGTSARGEFDVEILPSQPYEPGSQLLCRLDYLEGNYTGGNIARTNGTSWFFCGLMDQAIAPLGANASIDSYNANNGRFVFRLTDLEEGSYVLWTQVIDKARNESISPLARQEFKIDLQRPSLTVTEPGYITNGSDTLASDRFQCSDRNHNLWSASANEAIEVSSIKEFHAYQEGTSPKLFDCTDDPATENVDGPTGGQWPDDGPHTANFMVCDACHEVIATPLPNTYDRTWYIDTDPFDVTDLEPPSFSTATRLLEYNAGANNNNPYQLSHRRITDEGIYNNSIHRYLDEGPPTPPSLNQPFLSQAMNSCNIDGGYGRYQYTATDGCRPGVSLTASIINTGNGSCSLNNERYCPAFTGIVTDSKPGNPSGCPAGYTSCLDPFDGGYCGDTSVSSCRYFPARHQACRPQPCNLPWGGTIEHGDSVTAYQDPSVPCGDTCVSQIRSCSFGSLSGSYTNSSCIVDACPGPDCGPADGTSPASAPSGTDLCNEGSDSGVSGSGPWTWTCTVGAASVNCATVNGASCGPADINTYVNSGDIVSGDLCSFGGASAVSDGGTTWDWTCDDGTNTVSCDAGKSGSASCGPADTGGPYADASAANADGLCPAGMTANPTSLIGAGPWSWTCDDSGDIANCSASEVGACSNGAYSVSFNSWTPDNPDVTCGAGESPDPVTTYNQTRTWNCLDASSNPADSACCTTPPNSDLEQQDTYVASCSPDPIIGTCGGANTGGPYATAIDVEAAGLCTSGTANPTNLSDPGPWTWICEGQNGGGDSPTCRADQSGTWDVNARTPFCSDTRRTDPYWTTTMGYISANVLPDPTQSCSPIGETRTYMWNNSTSDAGCTTAPNLWMISLFDYECQP